MLRGGVAQVRPQQGIILAPGALDVPRLGGQVGQVETGRTGVDPRIVGLDDLAVFKAGGREVAELLVQVAELEPDPNGFGLADQLRECGLEVVACLVPSTLAR